jgi:hypothetical protein
MAAQGKQQNISARAGRPATKDLLVDVSRLEKEYFERKPDMADSGQAVKFGTSGQTQMSPTLPDVYQTPAKDGGRLKPPSTKRYQHQF